jgi:hypothetical protein
MRITRSAAVALTLASVATLAGTAGPAFAVGPQIDVTPAVAAPGSSVTFSVICISGLTPTPSPSPTGKSTPSASPSPSPTQSGGGTGSGNPGGGGNNGGGNNGGGSNGGGSNGGGSNGGGNNGGGNNGGGNNGGGSNSMGAVNPGGGQPAETGALDAVYLSDGTIGTSATLFGTTLGLGARIPMRSASHKGVFSVTVRLPGNIAAGSYAPSIDCSNGPSGTGTLTVRAGAVIPVGAPVTGDGVTSTATGGPLTAVGIGLLGLGGLCGAVAARRRTGARG